MPDFDPNNKTYLVDDPAWVAQVFKLEDGYLPTGGDISDATGGGTMNRQAQDLSNRTAYLKGEVDTLKAPGFYARPADITAAINALVGGAPGALDTLNEIAAALDDKSDFSTWVIDELRKASPIGEVKIWTDDTAPRGSLEGDRGTYLRADYPLLWAYIQTSAMYDPTGATIYMFGPGDGTTSFQMPETRGEFLRFWDNGRGVDPGRTLGSWQEDMFKSHTHNANARDSGSDSTGGGEFGGIDNSGNQSDLVTRATGGVETRPRGVAYMAVFRAY